MLAKVFGFLKERSGRGAFKIIPRARYYPGREDVRTDLDTAAQIGDHVQREAA